ncbi:classical arabinogalactan protein 9-like [Carya illinoinensis]|uniref:classical arabinogalactan protein 9-like n=1 Tax=Carya illinoinensis TaxID=32201 RepID=UPI001C7230BB|nr:classical arabinogalactan protein 9-like [Carya illinoinensis]
MMMSPVNLNLNNLYHCFVILQEIGSKSGGSETMIAKVFFVAVIFSVLLMSATDAARIRADRLVPGGPNPMEPPPTPVRIDRLVPGGPNPMEPPPTPVRIDRLVPGGPNPMEPPPTPTATTKN